MYPTGSITIAKGKLGDLCLMNVQDKIRMGELYNFALPAHRYLFTW